MPRVYCARCGRPNPDGARFCSYCGTQLTAPVPPGSGMPAGP
ncbi:MAG: zinc-ribbon domain-containing protein, partial [Streptosporangiaceae bacterium]